MTQRHPFRAAGLAALVLVGLVALPGSASAWWHRGWGWGWRPGVFFGFVPPVVIGPPVYYAPPPYYPYPRTAGPACYAGPYVCPLDRAGPAGAPCSCPTNTGRAAGRIG